MTTQFGFFESEQGWLSSIIELLIKYVYVSFIKETLQGDMSIF